VRARRDGVARHNVGGQSVEHRVGGDRRQAFGRAVERERLALAQIEQAGDLVDFGVNPLQPALGPARPAFAPHASDFWAHGLNVGVEVRY